jgi:Ribosomal protein S6E (S10)
MVEFKIVLSDAKTGRAYNVDVSGGAAGGLVGKKLVTISMQEYSVLPDTGWSSRVHLTATAPPHAGTCPLPDAGGSSLPRVWGLNP